MLSSYIELSESNKIRFLFSETHNGSNYEQQLLNLNEKLQLSQNQLKVKNIEVPEGGAGNKPR